VAFLKLLSEILRGIAQLGFIHTVGFTNLESGHR
jgi:hypothetical protein